MQFLPLLLTLAATACAAPPATEIKIDLEHDGSVERIVNHPDSSEIFTAVGEEKSEVQLPEGMSFLDSNGQDAGLRMLDLNGDGLEDLLFSNADHFAIYLWAKTVRPELGWTRGWSVKVHDAPRQGTAQEIASLVDADVSVDNEELVVTRGLDTQRHALKALLAFAMPPPLSPEQGLASLKVPEGFTVDLVAAEPVVVDPISIDWGADGRMWVVEMRDYPLGMDGESQAGGVVKFLTDTDGDGRFDKATVFMEGLSFPTGAMPWGKGVLIAASPEVIYAEDTDGDGKADQQEIILTGFNPENQQHRCNGFEYGLDGWIYMANGNSNGLVKSVKSGQSIDISGRDVRFKPATGELEAVSAGTQYGRRRDDWGNWFGNENSTWLWHVVLPDHYLQRNAKLAVNQVKKVLANYEDSTRVFPISQAIERPNQPWSIGHVTSGCSPSPYRDDLFGAEFQTTVFACEPVHNVVHREVLTRQGSTFSSQRADSEKEREFLASTDNWFRPVFARTGPDGALYVADFYRFVLEHPEWISPEMQARLDLRAGSDKGRIYRVRPTAAAKRTIPNLSKLTTTELVAALESPNGWQRDMAQRLLVEKADPEAATPIRKLLAPTHAPKVRAQALATLALLKKLKAADVLSLLNDPHPTVRCLALQQSESFAGKNDALFNAVANAASDSESEVRFQAALSLGAWPAKKAQPLLETLANRPDNDSWLHYAVLCSLSADSALFQRLNNKAATVETVSVPKLTPSSPNRAAVIKNYQASETLTGDATRGAVHFRTLCITCHRLKNEGAAVGPDLGMVASKPRDWLLNAILDPNQAIEARYRLWQVNLKEGATSAGIISSETTNNITLRLPGGIEQAILRSDIIELKPMNISLMPAGFESALMPADMADLLAYLQEAPPK